MSYKITWKTHIISFFITIGITFLFYNQIEIIIDNLIIQSFMQFLTASIFINVILIFTFAMFLITELHESAHGAANILFNGKVKYGFRGIYAYTQETTGRALSINEFTIVLLAPLMVISVLAFAMMIFNYWTGNILFILNLLGSSGDIYMAVSLSSYKYNSSIVDKPYGFDILNEN